MCRERLGIVLITLVFFALSCSEEKETGDESACGGTCADIATAAELTAALAGDGSCLCLLEGTYEGEFLIKRPVTLKGEGAEKTIILSQSDTPLTVRGPNDVSISDLGLKLELATLAETPALRVEARLPGPEEPGDVIQNVAVSNIAVSSVNGGGIRVTDTINFSLTNATITADAKGIVLLDMTVATLSGITTQECGRMGIAFANGAQGSVVNSTILRNGYTGLWIQDTSKVSVTDSTIKDNALAGINIVNAKNILIENSEIASSKELTGTPGADGIVVYTPELAGDPIMQRAFTLLNSTIKDHPRAALVFDGTEASTGKELRNLLFSGVTIFRMDYGVVFQNGLAPESFGGDSEAVSEDYSDGYDMGTSDVDTMNGGSDAAAIGDAEPASDGEMPDVDTPSSGDGTLDIPSEEEEF